jgi:import inner membrane translocase subunit TIM50
MKMATRQSFGLSKCIINLQRSNQADSLGRRGFTRLRGDSLVPRCSLMSNLLGSETSPSNISQICIRWNNNYNIRLYSTEDKKPKLGLADEILSAKIASEKKSEKEEEGTGEAKEEPKKAEPMPKWQKYGYLFLGLTMGGSLIANAVLFSMPDQDEQGNEIEDEYSSLPFPSQNYNRLKNKVFTTKKAIEEPFSDKLLPDPLEPPYYQPKYTIVVELTGLLVHSNWTHKHGWRFQKRPGLDMFLSQLGFPNFELVVWTVENSMTFFPILQAMDPEQRSIMYRLFRDATNYKNGVHIKELSTLNRDLKKVIVIDWNKEHVQHNPDNALIMKKWEGDNTDRSLIGLAQLIHEIKDSEIDDVRDVLTYYRQFEDPIEAFRENQRKLEEETRNQEETRKKEKETSRFSSFSGVSGFNIFKR